MHERACWHWPARDTAITLRTGAADGRLYHRHGLCHGVAMNDEIGGLLAAFDTAAGMTDCRAAVEQAAGRGQGLMLYELASALARHIDD